MWKNSLKKIANQQQLLAEYMQTLYPQDTVPTEIPKEKESSPVATALQFLLPMGLVAGGAYLGYKNLPKFLGKLQDITGKGFTQRDMLNLVGRYNRDIGHAVDRALNNWGTRGIV